MAFVVDLDVAGGNVIEEIKKWGGTHLFDVNIFDVSTGKQVPVGKKSIAVAHPGSQEAISSGSRCLNKNDQFGQNLNSGGRDLK